MTITNTLTVKVNGADREIFMSFGLLNVLSRHVGGVENVGTIALDHELRDTVLTEMLSERSKAGKLLNKIDMEDVDIEVDDVLKLLEWATEHVLNFFVNSLGTAKRLADQQAEKLASLMPSPDGSKA
jgi:hypothetical protein